MDELDLTKVDSFDLINELKKRGYYTGLLWNRDDVKSQLDNINEGLDEGESPIELSDDEMDDVLESSIDSDYHCQQINGSIFDTIWDDYKK